MTVEKMCLTSLEFERPPIVTRRLASSTEGRFTIIDECNKDSESFDDDDSEDGDTNIFSQSYSSARKTGLPCFGISTTSLPPMRMAATGVPVETDPQDPEAPQPVSEPSEAAQPVSKPAEAAQPVSKPSEAVSKPSEAVQPASKPSALPDKKYKRGRWNCHDSYDPTAAKRRNLVTTDGVVWTRSGVSDRVGHSTDDSDRENDDDTEAFTAKMLPAHERERHKLAEINRFHFATDHFNSESLELQLQSELGSNKRGSYMSSIDW